MMIMVAIMIHLITLLIFHLSILRHHTSTTLRLPSNNHSKHVLWFYVINMECYEDSDPPAERILMV